VPDGAACDANQKVRLRGHWVCPECEELSFELTTTVNGSLYFNPRRGCRRSWGGHIERVPEQRHDHDSPGPLPKGYLIVWAIDNTTAGNPIKFDGLIGDAVIRDQPDDLREGPGAIRHRDPGIQELACRTAIAPT